MKFAVKVDILQLYEQKQKNFQIGTLIKQLLTKHRFLKKSPQISHIHKNRIFKSIIGIFSF